MHLLIDILRNSILITGLVVVMMMMIESLNIESKGMIFKGLKKTKIGQVVIAALLGSIPGCMGGFATVSLYSHRMFSFGALVAMMIASSGDEAFIMLAMIPKQALMLFVILFVIAVVVGILVDIIGKKHNFKIQSECSDGYVVHDEYHDEHNPEHPDCHCDNAEHSDNLYTDRSDAEEKITGPEPRHFGWKRITMLIGLAVFIVALAGGQLGHDHSAHSHSHCTENHTHCDEAYSHCDETHSHCDEAHSHCDETHSHCDEAHSHCTEAGHQEHTSFNLLDEQWMNVLFAGLSVLVLLVLIFASDHFVDEHLWHHIVRRHLPVIFAWTFGVLLVLGIALQYVDIDHWISNNTALMILLATLIGIIPESGPHLIFVTLFATGVVPFPVLLASSISQDGHASIPLLAESRKSFLWAKVINCIVALAAGYAAMLISTLL